MTTPSFDHVVSLSKLSLDDASTALAHRETFVALLSRLSEVVGPTDRVDRLLFVLSLLAEEDAPWLVRGLTISFQHGGDGMSLMTIVTPTAPDVSGEGDPTFFLSLPVEEFGIAIMSNPDSVGSLTPRFDGADVFLDLPPRAILKPILVNAPTGPTTHQTRRIPSIVVPAAARPTPMPGGNTGEKSGSS